jgi:hypothetical protein
MDRDVLDRGAGGLPETLGDEVLSLAARLVKGVGEV